MNIEDKTKQILEKQGFRHSPTLSKLDESFLNPYTLKEDTGGIIIDIPFFGELSFMQITYYCNNSELLKKRVEILQKNKFYPYPSTLEHYRRFSRKEIKINKFEKYVSLIRNNF